MALFVIQDPGSGSWIHGAALTLRLGQEDDHFLFASMARYQFNGLLEEGKPGVEPLGRKHGDGSVFSVLPKSLVPVAADVELQVGLGQHGGQGDVLRLAHQQTAWKGPQTPNLLEKQSLLRRRIGAAGVSPRAQTPAVLRGGRMS